MTTDVEADAARLSRVRSYRILDTGREAAFDDLAILAASVCGTRMAAITIVDPDRQWFKASVGLEIRETPRGELFCSQMIKQQNELPVVEDASLDARFAANSLVVGSLRLRFYTCAPLVAPDGHAIGAICVIDTVGRTLSVQHQDETTSQVQADRDLTKFFSLSPRLLCVVNFEGNFVRLNPAWVKATGFSQEELLAKPLVYFVHPDDRAVMLAAVARLQSGHASEETFEIRCYQRDGTSRWLLWNAIPMPAERPIYATAHDITERKLAEVALAKTTAETARSNHELSSPQFAPAQQSVVAITEGKQAEEALLKAGALQSAIFNSANFSSIATDAKGVIQIFNVGAERMLGYTAVEVVNKIT
ncbi:MAG: PAS domain S-box protein, partial [Planctomycetota bacterium]